MIYIVVDCNCNNFGNYFKIIGHERRVEQDTTSYIVTEESGCIAHYPKGHCYRAKGVEFILRDYSGTFAYSSAIDHLIPKDYVRWMKTRFKGL